MCAFFVFWNTMAMGYPFVVGRGPLGARDEQNIGPKKDQELGRCLDS